MTNKEQEIWNKLVEIVVGNIGTDPAQITDCASIKDDLGADSLDCVEITMDIESEFGIAITDEEMESCDTFGKAFEIVKAKVAEGDGR